MYNKIEKKNYNILLVFEGNFLKKFWGIEGILKILSLGCFMM